MTQPKDVRLVTEATADEVVIGVLNDPASALKTRLNENYAGRGGYRVALLGASITSNNGDSTLVNNPTGGALAHGPVTVGIVTWANMILGQPMDIAISVSHGGYTSAQILAGVNDALAVDPDYVIGHDWWINDIAGGVSLATSQANILAIIDACNKKGATAILTDYVPIVAYTTRAQLVQHFAMMDWARSIQGRGFMFVPITDDFLDPATGAPLAGYTDDGTHASSIGAHVLGAAFANQIGHLFRGSDARHPVAWSTDFGNTQGNPNEIVANPMPNANLGPGMASFYTLGGSGAPVGSIIQATDHPNLKWQRITFGADGIATVVIGVTTGTGLTYNGLTLSPGATKMRFQFEWRMPSVSQPGKLLSLSGYQYFTPASDINYALQDPSNAVRDQGLIPDDNMIFFARGRERIVPVGTTATACALLVYGQAGAVLDIRRVSLAVVN